MPMTDEELDELWAELDEDGGGEIDFDEFYNWFVREAEGGQANKQQQQQNGTISATHICVGISSISPPST